MQFQIISVEVLNSKEYEVALFGRTLEGTSVTAFVKGFYPYFYVRKTWPNYQNQFVSGYLKNMKNDDGDPIELKGLVVNQRANVMYYGNPQEVYIKLVFKNQEDFNAARGKLQYRNHNFSDRGMGRKFKFETFESNLDPLFRFLHLKKLGPMQWVKLDNYVSTPLARTISEIEVDVKYGDIHPLDILKVSPIKIASFDIEVYSHSRDFPDAENPEDVCFQISTCFQNMGESRPYLKHTVSMRSVEGPLDWMVGEVKRFTVETQFAASKRFRFRCSGVTRMSFLDKKSKQVYFHSFQKPHLDPDDNRVFNDEKDSLWDYVAELDSEAVKCMSYGTNPEIHFENVLEQVVVEDLLVVDLVDNEVDVLRRWRDLIQNENPDIVTGYNIDRFDYKYMWKRAELFGWDWFQGLSRMLNEVAVLETKTFSSSARGDNEYYPVFMKGRVNIDMYKVIQIDFKFESYKLEDVAIELLGDQKEDMPYGYLFDVMESGTKDQVLESIIYCDYDAHLPLRLMMKVMTITKLIEMANVTNVRLYDLVYGGQSVKVFSCIAKQTLADGFVIPDLKRKDTEEDEDYEGATVLTPITGAYMDVRIATLDFASLYPTITIGYNLCYTTLYPPNVKPKPTDDVQTVEVSGRTYHFNQERQGILSKILISLLGARKAAKKEMARATDPFVKNILDGRQLALKVVCNSVYGFTGFSKGKLPCKPIAESITRIGRSLIETSKNLAETRYPGAVVVYGDTDSIMVNFNKATEKETFDVATEAGIYITERLNDAVRYKGVIDLEFEKVYHPYILYGKKRYAALKKEHIDEVPKKDIKGLQVIRRDFCKLTKKICNQTLDTLLYDRDIEKAKTYVQEAGRMMMAKKVKARDLVLSKTLRSTYKSGLPPHRVVVDKMNARLPGSAPGMGERVPYVFVKTAGGKDVKQADKAEDPVYVELNGVDLDYGYYFDHQIRNSVSDIMRPVCDDMDSILEDLSVRIRHSDTGQTRVSQYFGGEDSGALLATKKRTIRRVARAGDDPNQVRLNVTVNGVAAPTPVAKPKPKPKPKSKPKPSSGKQMKLTAFMK